MILFSCENNIENVSKFLDKKPKYDVFVKDIHMVYTDSGKAKFIIKAPELFAFNKKNDNYREFPKGVEFLVYSTHTSKTPDNYMKANYGIFYNSKNTAEAKGNVIMINGKGDTINTEYIKWDRNIKKIYSHKLVRIQTPYNTLIGKNGFEASEDFSVYELKKSKGKIKLKE